MTTKLIDSTAVPAIPVADQCLYGGPYCPPADIFAADGQWCSDYCQSMHRQSEVRMWRRAVAA